MRSAFPIPLIFAVLPGIACGADGWVRARALDRSSAVIPGIHITVHDVNGKEHCRGQSDIRGEFHCQVAPGAYAVGATSPNMFPFQRALVTVAPGGSAGLSIRPVFRGAGEPPPPKHLTRDLGTAGHLTIRYWGERREGKSVIFSGPDLQVTTGVLTLSSRRLSCSADLLRCTASDDVILDLTTHGFEELHGTAVELDLVLRQVRLHRAPTVTRPF